MKVLTVIGARPQFIKAAALSRIIKNTDGISEVILHTGQHFDSNMSEVFFDEMQIPKPDLNLGINSLRHGAMTGRMLEGIENCCVSEKPDVLLVYGDTNSTLAGALAAKKLGIKVAHVEAGLRSFNMKMPEEINRILTDRISDYLFCPTKTAVENLQNEGVEQQPDSTVYFTGDVMYDVSLYYAKSAEPSADIRSLAASSERFCLATIHREENTDDPERLQSIISALNGIHEEQAIICPLHPRTRSKLPDLKEVPRFKVIDPVGYFDILHLIQNCSIVLTDSGGLQKESYFFGKPCITLRDQTEWVELPETGTNIIAGADRDVILNSFGQLRDNTFQPSTELFGDGTAANKIIDKLLHA